MDYTKNLWKQTVAPTLSLFTSLSTLICCALPALLVTLGMGAALGGLVSQAPWLIVLSKYKVLLFSGSGLMLGISAFLQWKGRNAPCPADPLKAKACSRLRKISLLILSLSIVIYLIGFFFAFLAASILY